MLKLYSFPFAAMGTACTLHFYSGDNFEADPIADSAIAEVQRIEERYSRYCPDSFLSEINRVALHGGAIAVDEETGGLLDYAYACHAKSGGLFDISSGILRQAWEFTSSSLPAQEDIATLLASVGLDKLKWQAPRLEFTVRGMELDFGGLGKEYAADRAAAVCLSHGIRHGLVDLGGDIRVIGPHPDNSPWRIGILHPRQAESLLVTLEVYQGALASSGDYERCILLDGKRYSHILNPLTGWPVHGLSSVSVLAEQCMVAGSLCTIAMLKGRAGIPWLGGLDIPHVWVDEDGIQGGPLVVDAQTSPA
ncbi:MAG TPA: FAD:protein FMN transferase [Sulfuricella sp.]|nr:FAD:protein FMN transferase [Sulfuricella sp.]